MQEPAAEAPAAVVGYESSAESGEIPEERQPVQAAEVQSSAQQQPVADAAPALRPDRWVLCSCMTCCFPIGNEPANVGLVDALTDLRLQASTAPSSLVLRHASKY